MCNRIWNNYNHVGFVVHEKLYFLFLLSEIKSISHLHHHHHQPSLTANQSASACEQPVAGDKDDRGSP
jgi:hypothetical protein